MAETYKKLAQGQLTTSSGTLYTVPSATSTIIKYITLTNTTGGAQTAQLFHDGTSAATCILPIISIVAGGWAEFEGTIIMEAADTLAGDSDAGTSITYTVYGLEITS
jgi:hypothetical protein